jgi:hypothetical protein
MYVFWYAKRFLMSVDCRRFFSRMSEINRQCKHFFVRNVFHMNSNSIRVGWKNLHKNSIGFISHALSKHRLYM